MSGLYWLAMFLCVSRYESAEEECKEMFMQKMEKYNVMLGGWQRKGQCSKGQQQIGKKQKWEGTLE